MLKTKTCFIIASIALFSVIPTGSKAGDDVLHNWPWSGITVSASAAQPEDVYLLKKRLGINAIRLELNVRVLAQRNNLKPDATWARALEWTDTMLDACRQAGIVGIIAIAQFPIDPSLKITQESPEFWDNARHASETLGLIAQLGDRYKDRGKEFAAYEILSEPLIREGQSVRVPSSWRTLQMDIIKTIRKRDSMRYIVINPPPGGSPHAYADFQPFEGARLIYGAHMALPHAYTHQGVNGRKLGYTYPGRVAWSYWDKKALETSLAAVRTFQLRYNVPIWIGEFSVVRWAPGAEQYIRDITSLFKAYGWGSAYFAYHEFHGWNPDYDTSFASDAPDDWKKHYVGETSVRWQTLKEINR